MKNFIKKLNMSKKKTMSIVLIIAVFISIFSSFASNTFAAVFNKQINYQGKLTTSAYVAVPNGTYNMEFKLYDSGYNPIWTETRTGGNKVQVTNGLFSVMLGEVNSLSGIDFNQLLYLGVNIGGTASTPAWDGEMSPRKKLGAVPAAVEADKASRSVNLVGGNSTTLLGSIPYQSNTDTTSLLTPNVSAVKKFFNMTGTGTNGAIPSWDVITANDIGLGNVTNESKAIMFTSPTFTGTTNLADVSISGNIIPTTNNTQSLGSPSKVWKDLFVGNGSIYVNGQKVLQTDLSNSVIVSSDPAQNLIMQTTAGGNIELNPAVGNGSILLKSNVVITGGKAINTSDNSALSIPFGITTLTNISAVGTILGSNISGTTSGANTGDETASTIKTKLGITTLSGSNTGDNAVNSLYSGLVSSQWTTSGSDIYRSSGNVGIGTTGPGDKLEINNTVTGGLTLRTPTGTATSVLNRIQFLNESGTKVFSIEQDTGLSNYITWIKNTNASALNIASGYGGDSSSYLAFFTKGSSERMRIDNGGNVGIGTTGPGSKLAVRSATGGVLMPENQLYRLR